MVIGVTVMVSSHPKIQMMVEMGKIGKFWKNLEKLTSGNQNHTFKSWKNRIGNFRKFLQKLEKLTSGNQNPTFNTGKIEFSLEITGKLQGKTI